MNWMLMAASLYFAKGSIGNAWRSSLLTTFAFVTNEQSRRG